MPGSKMAAPRRPREEGEEEAAGEDASLEAKRPRGLRRLLVVLEGASLETVKVWTVRGPAGPKAAAGALAHLSVLWP